MLGVYVHFPYCRTKCPYCDFAVHVVAEIPHARYADAVLTELRLRAAGFEITEPSARGSQLRSIFFGGGTPSLWRPRDIDRVRGAIVARFGGTALEVTLEINPDDLDLNGFRALRAAGINRASIGVQSFDQAVLRGLGRTHSGERAKRAISDALTAGFASVSADLIYGGEGQTEAIAAFDADTAAALGAHHVSDYGLTLDELAVDVPLARLVRAGRVTVADADAQADLGRAAREALTARGLRRYEISNFALPGHESRHNLGYWAGAPYLGLGMGAYGATQLARYGNPRGVNAYLDPLEKGLLPEGERDVLDANARFRERLFLGLRRIAGLDLGELSRDFPSASLASLRSAPSKLPGLVSLTGDRLVLTERGLDLHSEVCARLI